MAGAAWWQALRQLLNPAARRGGGRRRRWYRPWPEYLEGRLAPAVTLSISNPMPFPKPDTGQLMGMFVVTRSGDQAPTVQVHYQTQDGTGTNGAHAGVDYVATSGTLTFAPNQTMATISVPIIGNNIFQADKMFTVSLSNPQSSAVGVDFAPQQTVAVNGYPISVAVGDFNGDGKPDLAVANGGFSGVSVLLNTTPPGATAPSFAPPQFFVTRGIPSAVAVGDFNGDGKPDLAIVCGTANTVSVLLNTTATGATTPSFAPPQTFATGSYPRSVAVGDFNGDGKLDLAVANEISNTVSVLMNTTPTGATVPSFAPQQTFAAGLWPTSVAVGDFNGDGKPDLVVANSPRTVSVLLNTMAVGATTPSFAPQQTFAVGFNPDAVTVGDFNGDGKPDLAVANAGDNTVSVLLNTTPMSATTPSFAPQQTYAVGTRPWSVAVGDFNGDGKLDVATANYESDTVSVLLDMPPPGATTPSFASQRTYATGRGPMSVAVGDFNGDGKPDLATANWSHDGGVSVLRNTSVIITGSPATGTISSALEAPATITVASGTTPQSAVVNTAFATLLAVDVRDASGTLVQGVSVTFTAPASGASGTFGGNASVMVITNASGRASAPTFMANTKVGTYMVTTRAMGGSNPSTRFTLTNTPGAPTTLNATAGNNQSTTVGTAFSMNLVVILTDQFGNVVPGVSIVFTAPSSGPGASFMGGTVGATDANGQVTKMAIANVVAGSYRVTAMTFASTSLSAGFSLTNTPGAADHFRGAALVTVVTPAPTTTALNSSLNPAKPGQLVILTAGVSTTVQGAGIPVGTVTFLDGTTALGAAMLSNGFASLTTTTLSLGKHTLTATYHGGTQDGVSFAASTTTFPLIETVRFRYFAVAGAPGFVQVRRDSDGSLITEFAPYGPGYTGPITVAVGDVNGDGVPDLVTAAAAGNPDVRVFDGMALENGSFNPADPSASLLAQWFAYGLNFNVGANVAVGDIEKDGFADVVTGATAGNPQVKVYRGKDIASDTFDANGASVLASFFAYGLNFNIGANVAVGDVSRNGYADVITGASAGNPQVKVYNGKDIASHTFDPNGGSVLAQWFAFGQQFHTGATVAVGEGFSNLFGSPLPFPINDVIVGASRGNPQVKVYDGQAIVNGTFSSVTPDSSLLNQFYAYNRLNANVGVNVAAADFEGTEGVDILTGPTQGPANFRVVKGTATGIMPPAVNGIDLVASDLTDGVSVGA